MILMCPWKEHRGVPDGLQWFSRSTTISTCSKTSDENIRISYASKLPIRDIFRWWIKQKIAVIDTYDDVSAGTLITHKISRQKKNETSFGGMFIILACNDGSALAVIRNNNKHNLTYIKYHKVVVYIDCITMYIFSGIGSGHRLQ